MALEGPRTVRAAHGSKIVVDRGWSPESADVLLVPGGHDGVQEEIRRGALPKALTDAVRPGLTIASVCTGAQLLSAAGISATAGRAAPGPTLGRSHGYRTTGGAVRGTRWGRRAGGPRGNRGLRSPRPAVTPPEAPHRLRTGTGSPP
ncbi:DJ-1/PfpI family protein [Streptomyces eurocidicus]|uniref:DJ-1/PfpI family protein n=1 Tax=Streptomyces eurocidicus TaxID=66423 RepID=UPI001FD37479|nr:DJ-1/PfpI family protein [Streptomyces eurocidicus]